MSHFILRWLNNIPSDDPIERQLAVLLQIALVGLILIIIGAIFLAIIAFESSPNAPAILRAIGLLITVGMVLMMMRRGHFKSGLWLVVGALLAIQLYGLYTGGLIDRGHALLSYVIPVSMAGLLIGRRALIIVMAVITAVLIITAVRDRAIAPEAASIDTLVALYFLVYGFFAILIEAFRSSFHQALANSAARAEELLKLSRRLEVTLTSIGDAVIVTDAQGQITLMNDVAQQLTGWTPEEAAGETLMTVFRIVNEETRLPVESPVDKVLREGTIVGLANHTILLAKDGREIPIDDSGAPIRNQKGNISGVVLVFRDIIERRQAEERADFLYRLTAALSHAVTPEQIADIVIDEGLTFFDVYRAGLVLFSEERKTARIIKHYGVEPDILEQYEEIKISDPHTPVFEVVRTGQPVWISSLEEYQERYPELARTIDSERRVEAFICLPLAVNDELAGCLFASFFPPMHLNESNRTFLLTLAEQCARTLERARLYRDEQQARVEAEEANRLKLQLLAMISHELRTPLTSIKGFASTLLEPDVQWEGENHRKFISIIDEEADKLTELVDQLLDLSRLQAGALHITPNNHSVGDIVNTARPQLSSLTRDHRFTIEVPEDLPQVFADLQRIAQVITNLVANSAHYSPAGTSITLSAHLQNDCVQIDVSDEGVGIAPEDRALVFEAFRQAERKGEGHHRGAGLGLAICKGLVEAQGGRIWIQDEVRTRTGTTISFTLLIYEGE